MLIIHTFDSIIIKLLAAEIVSHFPELTAYQDFAQNAISLDDQALVSTLDQDIEHSQLYNRANIHGFVEEPLFSWYIDVPVALHLFSSQLLKEFELTHNYLPENYLKELSRMYGAST